MLKIAVIGPESSGKTTLAQALAHELQGWFVAEFARDYLNGISRAYEEADLLKIAQGQALSEDMVLRFPVVPMMICDTDMITIRIWSMEKFARCDPWIVQQSEERHYDLFLLCAPDIPWTFDPLRENPMDRDRLFQVYMDMLDRLKKPYVIISGDAENRSASALEAIRRSEKVASV